MEKIGIAKLVEFKRIKNPGPKATLIKNLRKAKVDNDKDRGDYWITSTSACAASFWNKNSAYLHAKIDELKEKIEATKHKNTKDQFQKNIDNLYSMLEFDFESISPPATLKKEPLKENIFQIDQVPIQVRPQHIFSYKIGETYQVGAVWFVAKKDGYSSGELAMFSTAMYSYLRRRFSDEYSIDPEYCVAIDVSVVKEIRYSAIINDQVPNLLQSTIQDLKSFL